MIRKSELKLVKQDSEILLNPPKRFDFDGEIDSEMFSNIMIDKMRELGGFGLSANQVGVDTKMFVMGVGETTFSIFNPEIVSTSKEEVSLDEGCLSFPGIYIKVLRPVSVNVRFQDVKGKSREETLTGLTARIFLHEYDHMMGFTFKDRASRLKWDLAYHRMVRRTKKIIRKGVQKQLINIAREIKKYDRL